MNTYSKEDSQSLMLTGIAVDVAFFIHAFFLLTTRDLEVRHPILWIHVVVILACALFMCIVMLNMNNRIPVINEKVLAIGRSVLVLSAGAILSMWLFSAGTGILFFESVRGTSYDIALSGVYLLFLVASLSSIGLITSGLYDPRGEEAAEIE